MEALLDAGADINAYNMETPALKLLQPTRCRLAIRFRNIFVDCVLDRKGADPLHKMRTVGTLVGTRRKQLVTCHPQRHAFREKRIEFK